MQRWPRGYRLNYQLSIINYQCSMFNVQFCHPRVWFFPSLSFPTACISTSYSQNQSSCRRVRESLNRSTNIYSEVNVCGSMQRWPRGHLLNYQLSIINYQCSMFNFVIPAYDFSHPCHSRPPAYQHHTVRISLLAGEFGNLWIVAQIFIRK